MTRTKCLSLVITVILSVICLRAPASAQAAGADRAEEVGYRNEQDGTRLNASLTSPAGPGPHPGVVLLSIAGTTPLVERLVADGYAVLIPERRGFVAVEPLLRATFADLANDVQAALAYLGSRPKIDSAALGLVAQADDTPPAMLAGVALGGTIPVVLLAPPAFSGTETFQSEQRWAAERDGSGPDDLEALDEYTQRIAETVLSESQGYMRRYRLESVRAASRVELPRSAAFPSDERQMDFFASSLWHDRLAFEPEDVLSDLRSAVLVMIGADDPNTPMDEYLLAIRTGLADAETRDATVCRIPGRTRHVFTPAAVTTIVDWIGSRVSRSTDGRAPRPLTGCLEDTDR